MRGRGPSPLVPFVMVGTLGLLICWPLLLSLSEIVTPLFQIGSIIGIVLLVLVFIVHVLSSVFPTLGTTRFPATSAPAYTSDDDGFVFGMALLLLFWVLVHLL
ncbi:hypothetical protein TIFTF001_017788 [Ficus carica]|uniref:Uncharacterized protein n=1 Tax=Ficus carica TaxID=3494 RepID=A0AA88AA83_FICCA|nr:hypothetical protein TIFTF001_017788 [Ficus carica]